MLPDAAGPHETTNDLNLSCVCEFFIYLFISSCIKTKADGQLKLEGTASHRDATLIITNSVQEDVLNKL